MNIIRQRSTGSRGAMGGVSLIELMIAVTLGLLILAALVSIFAGSSAARSEMERTSRQIENGRFAMELLSDDLRLAGFYGELNTAIVMAPLALPDICAVDPATWSAAIPVHLQGWNNGIGVPACLPINNHKPNTDIVAIRRVATCEAGAAGCDPVQATRPYIQVSRCGTETVNVATSFVLDRAGGAFPLRLRNCATVAGMRRYIVRVYYVAQDNGLGQPVPTLKRLDFDGNRFTEASLVEGIEELNIEFGIDWAPNGAPDGAVEAYTADPTAFTAAGCTGCAAPANWMNVMTARIHLLARNVEPSPDYVDAKTYSLGRDAAGAPYDVTPGGNFRRHAYNGLVRIANAAQRRE